MHTHTHTHTHTGIEPTGWAAGDANAPSRQEKFIGDKIRIFRVAYSEHSSFTDLLDFIGFINPRIIVPTVSIAEYQKCEHLFCERASRLRSKYSNVQPLSRFFVSDGGGQMTLTNQSKTQTQTTTAAAAAGGRRNRARLTPSASASGAGEQRRKRDRNKDDDGGDGDDVVFVRTQFRNTDDVVVVIDDDDDDAEEVCVISD